MRFAPSPKPVPGGLAVPVDIRKISARLVFDTRTQRATGDATVDFTHGIDAGFPLFDLRQPVTGAWLDGNALRPEDVAHRRFGVRREESMRMVRRRLRAGDPHRLRIKYDVVCPPLLASGKGGYLPVLRWGPGGSVDFNFGFTDLGGGRYLEGWVPANLIYDRFALRLEVHVRGTAIPHALITNGDVIETAPNHWRIRYPDTFTALSPMLELHPRDSLEHGTRNGAKRIDAWKFRADPVNLEEQLVNIDRWLARNEAAVGKYHHGDCFVAFLHTGGMEYDGACTASADALEHEVFHSWWARGLKPASQNDGWIDEAWTVYHDLGAAGATPFNFREPPVRLCSATPWNRATPIQSYRLGARFFEGIAARLGVDRLHAIMNEFYALHAPGLVSTAQLESHILDRTNDEVILRAFERWVYGRRPRRLKPSS